MARDANARAAGTRAAAAPRARVRDEDWRSRHASVSDRAAAYVRIAYTYVANSRVCDAYVPDVTNARAARTRHGLTRGPGTRTRRAHAVASMPHTRMPHTSRHRRIGGDRRSSPRPRSPIGTTPACRARGNRTGSGRPRSGAVSRRGPGAFVALCRASESASAFAFAFAFAFEFDIWPFDPRPDPLLHRPASSTARAKYTRETIRAARAAGNPCVRRRETAAPGWTPPAGREAPGGKARGRGHIAAGTSARHAARRARHASRPGHAVLAPARAQRHTRTHAHTRTRTCARAPHAIRRCAPRRAQSTARNRLRASLGGAHRVAPRTVTSRRCLAARRPIRHTVILSCARNARGRPGRYRLHRPLVNPASRRARRDHASNAAITSHI